MKAIVFDNSGTLIKRYKAIKDLRTGIICDNIASINVVDQDKNRALVVLQTDPSKCINKAKPNQTIRHFLKKNGVDFDISYSQVNISKEELLDAIKDDKSCIRDIQDTYYFVVEKKYNVNICSGSGFIVNMKTGNIEFTITAGGRIFKEVPFVINELKNRGIDIFVASGDRKTSLEQLAMFINLPKKNVYDTANSRRKKEIIKELKKKYKVMMVGNSSNDILALEEADIGVLTLQQNDKTPAKVYATADYVIKNIQELLNIDF
ncbi:MAG: HAD family hydrolase [Methanobacterium sp.]|nr:HAD family hydrolase [Methanobacterium sp.]